MIVLSQMKHFFLHIIFFYNARISVFLTVAQYIVVIELVIVMNLVTKITFLKMHFNYCFVRDENISQIHLIFIFLPLM